MQPSQMLEKLDQIAWEKLNDAYGNAAYVPECLRALTHPDAATREAARDELWMGLCHQQCQLAEASAYAVPFLVELVTAPRVEERGKLLELLTCMAELARAHGGPCHDERCTVHPGTHAGACTATRAALSSQYTALLSLLHDITPDVRARAALLLGQLAQNDVSKRHSLVGTLVAALAQEPEGDTRVAYLHVLGLLRAYAPLRSALSAPSFAERLTAALALLAVDPPDAPSFRIVEEALEVRELSERQFGTAARYRPLSWVEDTCAAGRQAASTLLPLLLPIVLESTAPWAAPILTPLLATFFPPGEGDPQSAEQSAIACTIARNRHFFGRTSNVSSLLKRHGLPTRARPLRAYAERGPRGYERLLPPTPPPASPLDVIARACGGTAPEHATSVEIVGDGDDQVLTLLRKLPRLSQVLLASSKVSARGLAELAKIPGLRVLLLEDLALDRAGAEALAACAQLQYLTLSDVDLADEALSPLGALARLEFLCLRGTSLGADGFASFAATPLSTLFLEDGIDITPEVLRSLTLVSSLERLSLTGVHVAPLALRTLFGLRRLTQLTLEQLDLAHPFALPPRLFSLSLRHSRVSPRALAALAESTSLELLDLEGVALERAHLAALARCPNLKQLRVTSALTSVDTALLARLMPTLTIRLV